MDDLLLEGIHQSPKPETLLQPIVNSAVSLVVQGIPRIFDRDPSHIKAASEASIDDQGLPLIALRKDATKLQVENEKGISEVQRQMEEKQALNQRKQKLVSFQHAEFDESLPRPKNDQLNTAALATIASKVEKEIESRMTAELRRRDEEIAALKSSISKMENSMRSKHAELEDRDFRLSLIENSNHDGTMIWKIPQFSQRMSDALTGKNTSIFSLPFYTGRYGYKMCLRLYILGDGIGKNSHMSLFFVIMKGEFDNILQWPFTHKVTFKLINQTGGRDIIDIFQPDPMSSSFRKPKSAMNIASGCPRFVSHTELKNGDFIKDDTVVIECSMDCPSTT